MAKLETKERRFRDRGDETNFITFVCIVLLSRPLILREAFREVRIGLLWHKNNLFAKYSDGRAQRTLFKEKLQNCSVICIFRYLFHKVAERIFLLTFFVSMNTFVSVFKILIRI